jgi:citrate lyase subunit beta/citryl-CoA lyase
MIITVIMSACSAHFVPGIRADRFPTAHRSGADVVLLDLEDSVDSAEKETARTNVAEWLSLGPAPLARINGYDRPWREADLAIVRSFRCPVMLPKAGTPGLVLDVRGSIGAAVPLVALIETPLGILNAHQLCATVAIMRVALGSVDLATDLGVPPNDGDTLIQARVALLLASAAAHLCAPLEGVTTSLSDPGALNADIERSRALGFTGNPAVHPRQIGSINRGYSPSEDDRRWAQSALDAASWAAVTNFDGHMIGRPVLERARRLLTSAPIAGRGDTQ